MNRKEQEAMMKKMRELALNHPEKISIIETQVDANTQIEFFEHIQNLDADKNLKNININELVKELNDEQTDIERKKEILALLVIKGEVESYRAIENYLKIADKDIKTWAFLSCQQAKMFLESKLLEETKIYIASGLGGKDHRLRYAFAVKTNQEEFSDYQKDTVKGEVEYFFKKEDCITENIEFVDRYAIINALVPVYIDLVDLLQHVIKEINQYGNFLNPNVFITNEKKINVSELNNKLNN